MKTYEVFIDSSITVVIEANDIESARNKALETYDKNDLIDNAEVTAHEMEVK